MAADEHPRLPERGNRQRGHSCSKFLLISCRLLMKGKLAPARAALEIELDCFEHKRRLSGDIVRQRQTNNRRCIMPTSSR